MVNRLRTLRLIFGTTSASSETDCRQHGHLGVGGCGHGRNNGWDAEGQLRKATARALVLQADPGQDGVLNDEEAARTIALLPNARLVKWSNSPHGMHTQFPERFVETVQTFFAGCDLDQKQYVRRQKL